MLRVDVVIRHTFEFDTETLKSEHKAIVVDKITNMELLNVVASSYGGVINNAVNAMKGDPHVEYSLVGIVHMDREAKAYSEGKVPQAVRDALHAAKQKAEKDAKKKEQESGTPKTTGGQGDTKDKGTLI